MNRMSSNSSKEQKNPPASADAGSEVENTRSTRSSGGAGANVASREASPNDSAAASGAALVKESSPAEEQLLPRRTRRRRSDGPDASEQDHEKGITSPATAGSDENNSDTHTRPPSVAPSGDGERGCDNLHCIGGTPHGTVAQDEDMWSWCKDKIVKNNGFYKPWFPQFQDKIVSLTKDSISIDLEVLHETQPPIYKIGTRVSVVYDDGYAYPGAIVAEGARGNTYKIRLDEGTLFTTLLPDNDVDILDGPYRTKGRAAALKAQGGKRQRVAASRLNK